MRYTTGGQGSGARIVGADTDAVACANSFTRAYVGSHRPASAD